MCYAIARFYTAVKHFIGYFYWHRPPAVSNRTRYLFQEYPAIWYGTVRNIFGANLP